MLYKTCTKCGESLPATSEYFYYQRHKNNKIYLNNPCKKCRRKAHEKYFSENRDRLLNQRREFYKVNSERLKADARESYHRNKEKRNIQKKEYRKKNKDILNRKKTEYRKDKFLKDACYKLRHNLRANISSAFNRKYKTGKSLHLIGCCIYELKSYLEKQFKDGMSWDNYGINGWHIDHIKPCASFDLTDPKQQKECFHYTNLQPLWAEDNLRKGAKYE